MIMPRQVTNEKNTQRNTNNLHRWRTVGRVDCVGDRALNQLHQKILAEFKTDLCRKSVAEKLGVSIALTSAVAVKHGIPKNPRSVIEDEWADTIAALFADKMSRKDIAEKFDCSLTQLKRFCLKHGIDMIDCRKEDAPWRKEYRSRGGVSRALAEKGQFKSAKVQRIIELGILGYHENSIAAELKVSVDYVKRMLQVHRVRENDELEQMRRKIKHAEETKQIYRNSTANALCAMYGFSKGKAQYWINKVKVA